MKKHDILEILSLGENQNIEFKAVYKDIDSIGKIICAFLNSGGGYIIIGIDDNGDIRGIKNSLDINEIEKSIIEKLTPKALVSFEEEILKDKQILIIEVPSGSDIPYAYDNSVFIRSGEMTIQANIDTIRDMIMRRQIEPERWERRFSDADITRDLDENEIGATIRSDKHDKILTYSRNDTSIEMLEYLGFIKYGRLTCGGDVLFCTNPAKRFSQVRVKAVCYKDDKVDDNYIDMQTFSGPIVKNLENVFAFIKRNTPTQTKFNSESLAREEKSLYPLDALREGLVNAFAHRDYADFRGSILVQIFSNRIEIYNSGNFLDGITIDNITSGQLSILRNPDIAHTLYTRKYMEKLGRGGLLIRKRCEDFGLKTPMWTNDKHGVTLTFFLNGKVTTDVSMEVTTDVSMEVKKLILLMKNNKEYSRQDLQDKMNLKNSEYFRKAYIVPLLEKNIIEMTIPDKPKSSKQKYRLTKYGIEIHYMIMQYEDN